MWINKNEIEAFDQRYRANLINSLPGFKAVVLIGSTNKQEQLNVAPFNSVVHIGANPPYLGFIQRPDSVERHTFENILETGVYTFNLISSNGLNQAHQTSARYPRNVSEFEANGIEPEFKDEFLAPFVKGSPIKIGLALQEVIDIPLNGTKLIIGSVQHIFVEPNIISPDGFVNLTKANIAAAIGLDGYALPEKYIRFSYAKPDKPLDILENNGISQ